MKAVKINKRINNFKFRTSVHVLSLTAKYNLFKYIENYSALTGFL